MVETFTVILLPEAVPEFPDRCILCGRPHPGTTTYTTRDVSKGRAFWAGWYSVELPACRRCAWRLLLSQVYDVLRTVAVLIIAVGTFAFIKTRAPTWMAILGIGIVDILGIGFLVRWSLKHPTQFDIEPRDDSVSFEFLDPVQASEFAKANGARVEPPGDAAGRLTRA